MSVHQQLGCTLLVPFSDPNPASSTGNEPKFDSVVLPLVVVVVVVVVIVVIVVIVVVVQNTPKTCQRRCASNAVPPTLETNKGAAVSRSELNSPYPTGVLGVILDSSLELSGILPYPEGEPLLTSPVTTARPPNDLRCTSNSDTLSGLFSERFFDTVFYLSLIHI